MDQLKPGTPTVAVRELPPEVVAAAVAEGERLGVSGALDSADYIFWYIHDSKPEPSRAMAGSEYIESGVHAATLLRDVLAEANIQNILATRPDPSQKLSILEFASGYGRVTRHFPVVLPEADVVACDVHPGAVAFMEDIGLKACKSARIPENLDLGRTFDVIFVFSFFTHMPRSTWTRWLDALANHLKPRGLLIFTTHGEVSQRLMDVGELEDDGFFFHQRSEQEDLDGNDYGNNITTFGFVNTQLSSALGGGLKLVQFKEAAAGHHDIYVAQRAAKPRKRDSIDEIKHSVDQLKLEKQRLEAESQRVADENRALLASTSWRITAPLRALSRVLKR